MREIKFRGYAVEELVSESQWINNGFGVHRVRYVDGKEECYLYTENGVYEVHKDSVGQYTGLKDKNGKRIYEGDIVNVNHYGGTPRHEEVKYYKIAGFAGIHPFTDSGHHWSAKNCEIVGNVFENPELLKK